MSTKTTILTSPGHPHATDLAVAMEASPDTVHRMIRAGVAETIQYTAGKRIKRSWADRFLEKGLTQSERDQLTKYNKASKQRTATKKLSGRRQQKVAK